MTNLLQATRLDAGPVRLEQSWFPLEEPLGAALSRLEPTRATVRVLVDLPPTFPCCSETRSSSNNSSSTFC